MARLAACMCTDIGTKSLIPCSMALSDRTLASDSERLMCELSGAGRIVFDLDGTLYDTRDFERPALAAVADWLRDRSGRDLKGLTRSLWFSRGSVRQSPGRIYYFVNE